MTQAFYQTQFGSTAYLILEDNRKTYFCDYCGDVIAFYDLGMGNFHPSNVFRKGLHLCSQNPYLKQVKGRKDYQCENCKKIIPKGEKHLYKSTIPTGPLRIHIEC